MVALSDMASQQCYINYLCFSTKKPAKVLLFFELTKYFEGKITFFFILSRYYYILGNTSS